MSPRTRDACVACLVAFLLAILLTWPLAPRLGSASRIDSGDGRHGVWNVAWVAHALTTQPSALFDANIFYPNRQTLAYSEANLVAGVAALPVWLTTKNPIASYNIVVLLAFAGAALSGFLLVRVLGGSRLGATIGGLTYGFSPYMFAHLAHIQLLMTFGPALSLAAMHHFTKTPSLRRGLLLGGALALCGLACAYYGIFAGLAVGTGLLWSLVVERRRTEPRFWLGILAAAVVALAIVGPFFVPYLSVREAGFERSLDDARVYSSVGSGYLASAVLVHRWMLPLVGQWREVLFPGFQAMALALLAVGLAARRHHAISRPFVWLYVLIAALAFWTSLGPDAGLYTVLFKVVPAFTFLRAPARFGVLVTLGVSVLAGLAVTWLQQRVRTRRVWLFAALVIVSLVESYVGPLRLTDVPPVRAAHRRLAIMPRAPVVEFPFFQGEERYRHTDYMLMSTFHWQPLVNGDSDHFPADFMEANPLLATFPSAEAWAAIRQRHVRWLVVHFDRYSLEDQRQLRPQLRAMRDRLRLVIDDSGVSLYEVIWPTPPNESPRP